jgi:hypothetical protein
MSSYRHPFKEYVPTRRYKVDKVKLRADIKAATQEYLNSGKSIEKIKDGPTVKVPSVGLKDLGNELSFGTGGLYEAPDVYADMEIQLNEQLMEGDL